MWRFEASPRRATPKGLPSSFTQHRIPRGSYLIPAPLLLRSWHTDITYLPTREGWLYLATVIDLHNRELVGHAMADHMRAELIHDALDLAVKRGLISGNAIFHADRGSQYTSGLFRSALAGHGIRPSVGRTGSCFDNAVAESFFATLKTEIGTTVWDTRDDARRGVFAYLGYYNHDRLHSTLDYRTPHEVRVGYRQGLALVA